MKIWIVDHHVLFRQGLASLLSNEPGLEIDGEFETIEAVQERASLDCPDLVIMDPIFPNCGDIETIRQITNALPQSRILVLGPTISDRLLFGSIRAGAIGCLLKNMPISQLLTAIRAIEKGEAVLSRGLISRVFEEFRHLGESTPANNHNFNHLSCREVEILTELSRNASNEEIARKLVISENTVKVHVHNIIKKLNVKNRREAGQLARTSQLYGDEEEGLVRLD